MLKNNIIRWLDSRQNFLVGRALYSKLSDDEEIHNQLRLGENDKTKQLLKRCIQSLLNQDGQNVIPVTIVSESEIYPLRSNKVLDELKKECLPIYTRLNYLRAFIDNYGNANNQTSVSDRQTIAFEILDLENQCEAIWAKRDYYLKHGTLPEVDEREFDIPTDPKELAKLLQNIPRNIRRNRLKMQQPGAKALYAHLYTLYKDLYKQITGNEYVEKD